MARAWQRPDTGQWYVLHGRRGKILVGPDKKAAEFLAKKIDYEESQRRAGLLPKEDPVLLKRPSIEGWKDYVNYYLQWTRQNLRESSHKRYGSILRNLDIFLSKAFPHVSGLADFEPLVLEKYKLYRKSTPIARNGWPLTPALLKKLEKEGRPARPARDSTVNCELDILRSVFNHALDKGFIPKNPIRGVRRLEVREETPKRILTRKEAERFLAHVKSADRTDYEQFSMLLHTGMRIGELLHLHRSNIDLGKRIIHVRPFEFVSPLTGQKTWWSAKSKHRRGRREIPIDKVAFKILTDRGKRSDDPFVFGPYEKPSQFKKRVRRRILRYMKELGIGGIQGPHNLRHTFISWLAMAGKPKESIMDIVGHVEDETFELYRQTTPEHRAQLLDGLDLDI